MSLDMREFERSVTRLKARMKVKLPEALKDQAVALRLALARRNPVLTGRSSASWNTQAPNPDLSHQSELFAAPGDFRLRAGHVNVSGFKLGQTIHTTNTVPYIRALEGGHSQQAPFGFIYPTVREWRARMRSHMRRL